MISFLANADFRRRWLIPLLVAVAFFMEQFDNAALAVSLPAIANELGVEPLRLSLIITAYVLSVVLFMPASGWLANRFGARRVFAGALALYAAGSIGCSLAPDFATLVGFRVFQGLGGAMMTPVGRLIMLRSFERRELIAAMGLMTAPVLFGPLLGPLVGGFVTAHGDWRWLFLVNVPVVACAIATTFRLVGRDAPLPPTRFDLRGFLLLSPCLILLQVAIQALGRPWAPVAMVAALAAVALALLALYWRHARRAVVPLLDMSLFSVRSFAAGSLTGGLSRMGFNATPFLLPLHLQLVLGFSVPLSGAIVALAIVGSLAAKPFNGALVQLFGFRGVLVGSATTGALLIMALALEDGTAPLALLAAHVVVLGAVQTLQYNTLNILTYAEIGAERLSAASSLGGIVHQLAMGLAVSWSATALSLIGGAGSLRHGDFAVVFGLAGLLPLVAAIGYRRLSRHESGPAIAARDGASGKQYR